MSRLEQRSDMLLSTPAQAAARRLELLAKFPDRPAVRPKMLALVLAQNATDAGQTLLAKPALQARQEPADAAA